MKHTKRILATLLTVLLTLGVFAVGASAAPTIANLFDAMNAELNAANQPAREALEANPAFRARTEFGGMATAYRAGSTAATLATAVAAIEADRATSLAAFNAGRAEFIAMTEAQWNAAVANGSVAAFIQATIVEWNNFVAAEAAAIANNLRPQAVTVAARLVEIEDLEAVIAAGTAQQQLAVSAALAAVNAIDVNGMAAAGQWTELVAELNDAIAGLRTAMVSANLLPTQPPPPPPPPPPNRPWWARLPRFLQWIFRWVFFGWIWMR